MLRDLRIIGGLHDKFLRAFGQIWRLNAGEYAPRVCLSSS